MPPSLYNVSKAFALSACLRLRPQSFTASAFSPSQASLHRRSMSSTPRTSQSHEERTADEPRENATHTVVLSKISQVNSTVRLLQLRIPNAQFLAGQWLDVHIPSLPRAGGFTITSTPRDADPTLHPPNPDNPHSPDNSTGTSSALPSTSPAYLELAIQRTSNPPAAWLWRPEAEILGTELRVRVGGSFVWPPPGVEIKTVQRIVFVAGGVGINPLMSILSHLYEKHTTLPRSIQVLYTTRPAPNSTSSSILFLPRLRRLFNADRPIPQPTGESPFTVSPTPGLTLTSRRDASMADESPAGGDRRLQLFLTGTAEPPSSPSPISAPTDQNSFLSPAIVTHNRRIGREDLMEALGPVEQRKGVVVYVCGPARMTDEFVNVMGGADGMDGGRRVFCEKWW